MRGYHALQALLLYLMSHSTVAKEQRHQGGGAEPQDPMDAYLLSPAMDPEAHMVAAAESIAAPSAKLQGPFLPFGTRLKPPKGYVAPHSPPPSQLPPLPPPEPKPLRTATPSLPNVAAPVTKVRPTVPPGLVTLSQRTARPRLPIPTRLPLSQRDSASSRTAAPTRPTVPPRLLIPAKPTARPALKSGPTVRPKKPTRAPPTRRTVPPRVLLPTKPTARPGLELGPTVKPKKPTHASFGKPNKSRTCQGKCANSKQEPHQKQEQHQKQEAQKRGGNGNNPKPQASFFFTNVGPHHFEYRGVFEPNTLPLSFNGDPEAFLQLIPQLPRLFQDPFPPPPQSKGLPPQLLLGVPPPPPPKEPPTGNVPPPPPPPLTILQPVVNLLPQHNPPKNAFPQYDYVLGGGIGRGVDGEYPRIFRFNDERISIIDFDRHKRAGSFSRRRGDALDPDRVPRQHFLIFHGGQFPSSVGYLEDNSIFSQRTPKTQLTESYQPEPPPPPPPAPPVYLPVRPTLGKVKPGGFVYFIRT